MKTMKLDLDFSRPANSVEFERGRKMLRELVKSLDKKFGTKKDGK